MPKSSAAKSEPREREFYVAFSIHGTDCFITANRRVSDDVGVSDEKSATYRIDGFRFTKGRSRGTPLRGAIKLLWSDLEEKGRPLSDPETILRVFHRLRLAGWKIDDAAFIRRHRLQALDKDLRTVPAAAVQQQTGTAGLLATAIEGYRIAASADALAFRPSEHALGEVEKVDPKLAERLRTMPLKSDLPTPAEPGAPTGVLPDDVRDAKLAASDVSTKTPPSDETIGTVAHADHDPEYPKAQGTELRIQQGDICTIPADVIVNAANAQLIPGGGVDGALNRAAGPELGAAMRALNGCETGQAKITPAFALPAKFVAHAVGPIYAEHTPEEAEKLLAAAYTNAFRRGYEVYDNESSTYFTAPLLSTGVYGYPMADACRVAVAACHDFIYKNPGTRITLVAFDDAAFKILADALKAHALAN